MAEPSIAIETQSKTVATETNPSKTLRTNDTFEVDPEEYDEDEASSNKKSEDEGKKESMATSKE